MEHSYKLITLKGRVQGVGFRFSAREQARKYGVKGYVKNLPNGNVEIKVSGPENKVQHYLRWCKEGPSHAYVEDMFVEDTEPENFETFDVKH